MDKKAMMQKAVASGNYYGLKPGWRKLLIFTAVLLCLLVITIPLGIWFFMIAKKGGLGLTDEGFVFKYLGTQAYAWDDIESFEPAKLNMNIGGGLVGAVAGHMTAKAIEKRTQGLKGPLRFKRKGKRGWRMIPGHMVESSGEWASRMEEHTGLQIFPRPTITEGGDAPTEG